MSAAVVLARARHAGSVDPGHAEHLATERSRTVEQITSLQSTFDDIVHATEDVSTDDEHDPEGHTIAWERQQTAALLASAKARLAELDLAIRRVEGGDYGRCEACGKPIGDERLEAIPTASTCIACAT
jgi:DnaK suppressor protein